MSFWARIAVLVVVTVAEELLRARRKQSPLRCRLPTQPDT
jgi:hypothetical protein